MPKKLQNSKYVQNALNDIANMAKRMRHEFYMPEHLLLALLSQQPFRTALSYSNAKPAALEKEVRKYLTQMERVPADVKCDTSPSSQLDQLFNVAYQYVLNSSAKQLDVPHLVMALLQLPNSQAAYMLTKAVSHDVQGFLSTVISEYGGTDDYIVEHEEGETGKDAEEDDQTWRSQVTCLNDLVALRNPLIGREAELERTIQVLCRREKNNPLHVGESGVGKTALVYGLAARIAEGKVPERLQGSRIYQMDLGALLAGTQFRGDFEKRVKLIMDGAKREGKAIIYIDEIHNLVGAGRTSDGSMDASNMLKPYLEGGDIRFIGSTTYDEYNRFFSKSKGIVRRFQQIDIDEPSVDETVRILLGLKDKYEEFHQVTYPDEVIEYAVKASAKYVNDRFLPDKAIDLIDEAGAYRELHPGEDGSMVVDKQLISDVLAKVCKVDAMAMKEDDTEQLETLRERVEASIYGQDEAVRQVVEAVQMSKAGLLDDDKPLASLLFVGPTGVGKTEVARVLARELGIALVRFDMSEYTEKHTVAKLIGSPAGYVGYEDGGLLTDAIRKTPNCVLLLDEIEKAHPDIYNILLQVMDYAKLTDNRGRKADFRNVVLVMTSNAGAQYAKQASVGFGANVSAGEAMVKQVKKTFKPEFINRLSAMVVFNDMDHTMAGMILDKKLRELNDRLLARKVKMTIGDEARQLLLEQGFTREYGARELDRVITRDLKPLLMREILFGRLKDGGDVTLAVADGKLKLEV
ncbi:MAG: AAA family ATPase [Prevotella sp.]|nr:AAA family ATPase [Prevotella sp.]